MSSKAQHVLCALMDEAKFGSDVLEQQNGARGGGDGRGGGGNSRSGCSSSAVAQMVVTTRDVSKLIAPLRSRLVPLKVSRNRVRERDMDGCPVVRAVDEGAWPEFDARQVNTAFVPGHDRHSLSCGLHGRKLFYVGHL